MISHLKLFLDITLARRGPEDLPVSAQLLAATALAYVVLFAALVVALGAPTENWLGQLIVSTLFTLAWMRALLALFNKPERFLQTTTATFGISLLTLPFAVPLQLKIIRIMEEASKLPAAAGAAAPAPTPAATAIIFIALPLLLWVVYAQARVLRAALEVPMFKAVLLIVAQTVFESLLLSVLFAPAATRAAG